MNESGANLFGVFWTVDFESSPSTTILLQRGAIQVGSHGTLAGQSDASLFEVLNIVNSKT